MTSERLWSSEKVRRNSFDDEFSLQELYEDVDFQLDLKDVASDSSTILQSLAQRLIIHKQLKRYYEKAKQKLRSPGQKSIREMVLDKKQKLEKKFRAPLPFLRNQDKIAFTTGLLILCLTEFVMLKYPQFMPIWYTLLVFPLLTARWYLYHKSKYQYFLLDFCYYAQVMLLFNIHFLSRSAQFFQLVFSISNGPLLVGIVAWRNSLVFHDLDKLTSVFIHLFPALVTFCMRWYPANGDFHGVCTNENCSVSLYNTFVLSFVGYTVWQIMYLIKTEIIDKERLAKDCELMTSARWMTEYRPHPLWKLWVKKFNVSVKHAPYVLAITQYIYTFITLIPILFIYEYFYAHVLYLAVIFLSCIWNGASFYFEIFAETYKKRLELSMNENNAKKKIIGENLPTTDNNATQLVKEETVTTK